MEGVQYQKLDANRQRHGCLQVFTMLVSVSALVGVMLLFSTGPASHPILTTQLNRDVDIGRLLDDRLSQMESRIDNLNQSVSTLRGTTAQLSKDLVVWQAVDADRIQGMQSQLNDKVGEQEFQAALGQMQKTLANKVNEQQLIQAMADVKAKISGQYQGVQHQIDMLAVHSCRACQRIDGWDNACGNGQCGCGITCSGWTSANSTGGAWSAQMVEDQDGRPGGCKVQILLQCQNA
mmetsp:Transcript_13380/g.24943  ORF Transcript_13380/g.24943 Transcript_13380/m.24943 type:complete len:235 (-) Transcript_13380:8-712(-)